MFLSILLSGLGVDDLRFVELWGGGEDGVGDLLRVLGDGEAAVVY